MPSGKKAHKHMSEYLSETRRRDLAGDSLWTFNLPPAPGFPECDVYYVTRTFQGRPGPSRHDRGGQLPFLFTIQFFEKDKEIKFKVKEHRWHPTHTETVFRASGLRLSEEKFITSDDQAISCLHLENTGQRPR